jgi:hypothetical protein
VGAVIAAVAVTWQSIIVAVNAEYDIVNIFQVVV